MSHNPPLEPQGPVRPKARPEEVASPIPAPPALALPKGGGAIRGIDEKLTVNPTGTAALTVPLPLSPGRAGFGPSLAVTYDSGAGNGPFGLGWSLALPSVCRKTERGLPRYRDAAESDVFVLSGAEDLVPGLTGDGRDSVERDGHRVDRYRPRLEGGHARIERWTRLEDGDVHWRVVGPDNLTTLYGRSDVARIVDPTDRGRIFEWLIEESRDDRGNVVRYEYKPEDGVGIDGSWPFEGNRIAAGFSQRYLKRVLYGNDRPGDARDWHFELVLDYGEHDDDAAPDGPRPWPIRADPFSVHRAGFEVRTYRLCRRALMFHRFPELGGPTLVRSLVFRYASDPALTKLESVTPFGHDPGAAEGERTKAMPPLTFTYTAAAAPAAEVRTLDPSSLENLPEGVDGARYQWLDLEGEGVSGILSEFADAWMYKRNLGGGRFAPSELVAARPSVTNVPENRAQLLDLAGDGQVSVVHFAGPLPGHQDRGLDGEWLPFAPFASQPNLVWDDPDLRFVDLDGDGRSDVLITRDDVFRWHPSVGRDGFLDAETVPVAEDEERGPRVVFSDGTQSIVLADLSGDGLADMVRIRNGEVCYWPNLGYGRFGAKVTMDHPPVFDAPDLFRPDRIRLADLDGTGPVDIVYLGGSGVRYWFNQAGNGWSAEHRLAFPLLDASSSATVVDLLGTGTACLVWSSPLPGHAGAPLQFVELLGGEKPHLLSSVINNLGGETRVTYAPSTRFFLEDRAAGTPWVTKLPFPVHVVERIETSDRVTGLRFASRYRYRHGFYDRDEREFRGFGYVEQQDTESYPEFARSGGHDLEEEHFLPPVVTKTWVHTGSYREGGKLARAFENEYYSADVHPQARPFSDTVLPDGLADAEEVREAVRALKGQVLRREVYALDAGPAAESQARARRPYTVAESAYEIRRLQPRGANRHGVFRVHSAQAVTYHYERNPADPRVAHELTLEVDDFGVVTKAASVAYARRSPAFDEQGRTTIVYTESDVLHQLGNGGEHDPYRLGLPSESRTYELTGLPAHAGLYEHADLRGFLASATEIPHEGVADGRRRKRLLARQRVTYYSDDLSSELALGRAGRRALPYRSYQLAFTPGLLAEVYGERVTGTMLERAGHHRFPDEDDWWTRSGRATFDPPRFYLPVQFEDPFGAALLVQYDGASLLPTGTRDALGNRVEVRNDYRILAPIWILDPNGNRSAVRFDALGLVVASAAMGREGGDEGDTLDDPTRRLEYDALRWLREGRPVVVHSRARERHRDPATRWQETYSYSGGLGQEVMTKVRAEPEAGTSEARWVGTGRTLFNNKGLPIKQYEPFFSRTFEYEHEREVVEQGVTSVMRYDALGRLVRTEFPNGTVSRVEFDPWRQADWDANDTVLESPWHARRIGGLDGAAEQRAARGTERHADTPSVAHFDVLGRPFLAEADNGPGSDGRHRILRTLSEVDVVGNLLAITDPRGNVVMRYRYDAAGRLLSQHGRDAGPRWVLPDVAGKPVLTWDRERAFVETHDVLQRPTELVVRALGPSEEGAVPHPAPEGAPEVLARRLVYGEAVVGGDLLNLRGRVHQQFDGAGLATNEAFDFKGNLLRSNRWLLASHRDRPDWHRADVALEDQPPFVSRVEYDALDRPIRLQPPDGTEIRPTYNDAGLLERIDVRHRGAAASAPFIQNVDYDAKGQRTSVHYGNGAITTYTYDRFTFRLATLTTERPRSPRLVQALAYTYDPSGNVLEIRDDAQPTVFFRNTVVDAHNFYEYDALYRLVRAEGREHVATAGVQWDEREFPRMRVVHENDTGALRRYIETYDYDDAGNLLVMAHEAGEGSWRRRYEYAEASNRLLSTSVPDDLPGVALPQRYVYDAHGNMTRMPHLPVLGWDFDDQLQMSQRQVAGSETIANRTYYAYDAGGQRVRKVAEKDEGALLEERVYIGGWEVFRSTRAGSLERRRETLHVMDDTRRVALIETLTDGSGDRTPAIRYQLDNHLGSASIELDNDAEVISYEEYHPYGTTAYHSARSAAEVSLKRYRYTGMERDEETELAYHTARYYAPWLGRWCSADPVGTAAGLNLFAYSFNNPTCNTDPSGCDPPPPAMRMDATRAMERARARPRPQWEEIMRSRARASEAQAEPPTDPVPDAPDRPQPVDPAAPPADVGIAERAIARELRRLEIIVRMAETNAALDAERDFGRNLDIDLLTEPFTRRTQWLYSRVQPGPAITSDLAYASVYAATYEVASIPHIAADALEEHDRQARDAIEEMSELQRQLDREAVLESGEGYRSGRTRLQAFDMDRMAAFNTERRRRDSFAGHEMLQNAWLRYRYGVRRGSGVIVGENPAVALPHDLHVAVGREQRRLGLFTEATVRALSAEQNIILNDLAMRRAGVPHDVRVQLRRESVRYAATLRARHGH